MSWALELVLKACILIAVLLITSVATIIYVVAYLCREETPLIVALELAGSAVEGRTTWGLVTSITTVVLAVTAPPEGNAFVGFFA